MRAVFRRAHPHSMTDPDFSLPHPKDRGDVARRRVTTIPSLSPVETPNAPRRLTSHCNDIRRSPGENDSRAM
jgi:hypothetical protein